MAAIATNSEMVPRLRPSAEVANTIRQEMGTPVRPIRVTVVQPALAKYRMPVFRELAARPGLDVRVVYGSTKGLPNVVPEGFDAIPGPRWQGKLAGSLVMFHGAEWTYCSRRYSDVVVLRWSPRSVTLLPALLRARMAGLPVVLWGHGYAKGESQRRRGSRKWIARYADAIVFYEPQTREDYIRDGFNPDSLFVALNSLEHSEMDQARKWWQDRPQELAKFRQEQGIASGPVVLFISRHQPANRVALLIEATVQLVKKIPGLKSVIIGNGEPEKSRLQSISSREGVESSVVFLDGVYDELKLAPWLLSADVFCYPANVGLSLIHALWYGLPVVTSDKLSIQNPEVVALEHGINGLTYEHGSVESLAETLQTIVTDPALQASMSQAARRTVEDRFTIPGMVDGLEAAVRYAAKIKPIRP